MRISEVVKRTDLTADTLRYYERIGLLPPISRTDSGIRDYQDIDIRRIEFVKCMRRAGLPVEVLIEYYKLVRQGDETIPERKRILVEQRDVLKDQLKDLQETLNLLEYKINVYENIVLEKENEIS
jgi:DNA-binding transcriptional MerR regulator